MSIVWLQEQVQALAAATATATATAADATATDAAAAALATATATANARIITLEFKDSCFADLLFVSESLLAFGCTTLKTKRWCVDLEAWDHECIWTRYFFLASSSKQKDRELVTILRGLQGEIQNGYFAYLVTRPL